MLTKRISVSEHEAGKLIIILCCLLSIIGLQDLSSPHTYRDILSAKAQGKTHEALTSTKWCCFCKADGVSCWNWFWSWVQVCSFISTSWILQHETNLWALTLRLMLLLKEIWKSRCTLPRVPWFAWWCFGTIHRQWHPSASWWTETGGIGLRGVSIGVTPALRRIWTLFQSAESFLSLSSLFLTSVGQPQSQCFLEQLCCWGTRNGLHYAQEPCRTLCWVEVPFPPFCGELLANNNRDSKWVMVPKYFFSVIPSNISVKDH